MQRVATTNTQNQVTEMTERDTVPTPEKNEHQCGSFFPYFFVKRQCEGSEIFFFYYFVTPPPRAYILSDSLAHIQYATKTTYTRNLCVYKFVLFVLVFYTHVYLLI